MTDRQAFLNAIIDRPDDDLLRLVFADYLEENGDADRAEFIRLQVEHAASQPDSDGWMVRESRLRELLRIHDWRIPDLRGKQDFRRGFVEAVSTTAERLIALPDEAFDSTPVRELRVWMARDHLEDVADLPWMRRAETLDLRNSDLGIHDRMLVFFSVVRLDRLRALGMRYNVLWADNLTTFFRSWTDFRQLEALDLSGNPLGDDGMRVLTGQPLHNLRELTFRTEDLQYADCLHADGMVALANSPGLTGLERLDLRGHHIGDAGFMDLIGSPNAARLRLLDVGFNDIGDTGDSAVEALRSSPHLGDLRVLRLNGNAIDRLWADALTAWDRLHQLEELDLGRCEFGPGARRVLEQSPHAAKIKFDE
jgi:uncharacterized protein (TIGR02996 family)